MTTVKQMIKRSSSVVYRRAFLKRRSVANTGSYEDNWQDITEDVKRWGTIRFDMEDERVNRFKLSGTNLNVKNEDGKYNPHEEGDSFWNMFLPSYKTRLKIEAGYIDEAGVEVPANNVMFEGIITDDIDLTNKNEANLRAQSLMVALKDVTASRISGLTGSQTASDVVTLFRDLRDSNSVLVFNDFISTAAWNIQTTTNIYTNLNTTTSLDELSVYEALVKLAEAENLAIWVDPNGTFNFAAKVANTSVTQWVFQGPVVKQKEFGVSIKSIDSYKDATQKIFTRIRVQIDKASTSTSFRTVQESWVVGDSSTSWLYGERTLEFENTWLNTATADTVIGNMQKDYGIAKREVRIRTKFMPQLKLLDLVEMSYSSDRSNQDVTLWGGFLWGKKLWRGTIGKQFKIDGKFLVRGIAHDIDRFESRFFLREN